MKGVFTNITIVLLRKNAPIRTKPVDFNYDPGQILIRNESHEPPREKSPVAAEAALY